MAEKSATRGFGVKNSWSKDGKSKKPGKKENLGRTHVLLGSLKRNLVAYCKRTERGISEVVREAVAEKIKK